MTNAAFPEAELTPADLISTWAGLRPLVADRNGNPSDISRRHEVKMNEPGWWDVTGGKLTTYRLMAEETVNAIAKYVGATNKKCETARRPLLEPKATSNISGIVPPPVSEVLGAALLPERMGATLGRFDDSPHQLAALSAGSFGSRGQCRKVDGRGVGLGRSASSIGDCGVSKVTLG